MTKKRATRRGSPKLSPELVDALASKTADSQPLTVVYQFKGGAGQLVPPAEEVDALVEKVLGETARTSQLKPERQNVLRNMGSVVVKGQAELHRALVARPEFKAAVLSGGVSAMPPVKRGGPPKRRDWVEAK